MVAPLDWGLGHATRCIPIIHALMHQGIEVWAAAEGAQQILLQQEFPGLRVLPLKGYGINYSKKKSLLPFKLLTQLPRLLGLISYERKWLQQTIETHAIDLVISDNRYGLCSNKIPCIFITHQLTIKAPYQWLEAILQRINYSYINKFTACWVPDAEGENNIAGELSHPRQMPKVPVHYIGLLARFHKTGAEKKYDRCIVLSGPEPQRTFLEHQIMCSLPQLEGKTLFVRGKPGSEERLQSGKQYQVENHLPTAALQEAFLQSEWIICRSGYTTIMELMALEKKSILIPTPGQTEQEYLARELTKKNYAFCVKQRSFDLVMAIAEAKNFSYRLPVIHRFEEKDINGLLQNVVCK